MLWVDPELCFECTEDPPVQSGYVFDGTGLMTRIVTCEAGFGGDPVNISCIDANIWEEAQGCVFLGPLPTFYTTQSLFELLHYFSLLYVSLRYRIMFLTLCSLSMLNSRRMS